MDLSELRNEPKVAIQDVEMDDSVVLLESAELNGESRKSGLERLTSSESDVNSRLSDDGANNKTPLDGMSTAVNGHFNKQLRANAIREIRRPGKGNRIQEL